MASTVIAFALKQTTPPAKWSATKPRGLEAVAGHVSASGGEAAVIPLDPTGTTIQSGANMQFVAPDPTSPDRATQAIHFLRLGANSPFGALRDALRADARVEYVEELRPEHIVFPAVNAHGIAPFGGAAAMPEHQWSINRCRFPDVWSTFETGTDPGAVFVIDNGPPSATSLLGAGQLNYHPRKFGQSSTADHAAAVVGVVAPHRGAVAGLGCSSATIELFNVFDETGTLDKADLCLALVAAAKAKAAVVNMSFTMMEIPRCLETSIQACKKANVVLVAAMGESSAPNARFPAKHKDVIAVGGTTRGETRHPNWPSGNYMFISAPAEFIETVSPIKLSGTSFAAPLVSGAIWLARRKRPKLSVSGVRTVLKQSVFVPPNANPADVGFGRLDMVAMKKVLDKMK